MSEETQEEQYADVDTSHLEDVEDGCGCTEIWEHTSQREDEGAEPVDAEEADEGTRAGPSD